MQHSGTSAVAVTKSSASPALAWRGDAFGTHEWLETSDGYVAAEVWRVESGEWLWRVAPKSPWASVWSFPHYGHEPTRSLAKAAATVEAMKACPLPSYHEALRR